MLYELTPAEKIELLDVIDSTPIMNFKTAICFRSDGILGNFMIFKEVMYKNLSDGRTIGYLLPALEIIRKKRSTELKEDLQTFFGRRTNPLLKIIKLEIKTIKRIEILCNRKEGNDLVFYIPDDTINIYSSFKNNIYFSPVVNNLIAITNKEKAIEEFEEETAEIEQQHDNIDTELENMNKRRIEKMKDADKPEEEKKE